MDEAKKTAAFLQGKTVTGPRQGRGKRQALRQDYQQGNRRRRFPGIQRAGEQEKVELSADIKAQGEFTFEVKLHAGVTASMKVIVTA